MVLYLPILSPFKTRRKTVNAFRLHWRFVLSVALLTGLLASKDAVAENPPLIVFSSDIDAQPYIRTDGVTIIGGIVKDINDEAARRLGITIDYKLIARRSVDAVMQAGDGHVTCNIQPAWTGIADQLIWTEPMLEDQDVYWRLSDTPALTSVDDLKGKSFMTYAGYTHGDAVTAQVTAKETRRVNLYASQNIMQELLRGRAAYAIFSKIRGQYLMSRKDYAGKIEPAGLVDSTYNNFCAIAPSSPVDPNLYASTLNDIAKDGTLEKILEQYR